MVCPHAFESQSTGSSRLLSLQKPSSNRSVHIRTGHERSPQEDERGPCLQAILGWCGGVTAAVLRRGKVARHL
jgi:hypothetical protein